VFRLVISLGSIALGDFRENDKLFFTTGDIGHKEEEGGCELFKIPFIDVLGGALLGLGIKDDFTVVFLEFFANDGILIVGTNGLDD
tara:strand:+ start:960 stop:1217 length:258 start_codon:yes stop_codon:yes gene_type:complete